MKKILIFAALLFSTGVISSCTKDNVTPTTETVSGAAESGGGLGTGDGGIDRPVRKP